MIPRLGLWVDCPPGRVLSGPRALRAYWDELRALGISTAAIMVDSSSAGWDPRWTGDQISDACAHAVARDVEVVLTVWPTPDCRAIDAMLAAVEDWVRLGVAGVELDCEGLWRTRHVAGFADLEDAGGYLIRHIREVTSPCDVRVEITSHGGHAETGSAATLSPLCDRLYVQAYSVRHRPERRTVGWESPSGPGYLQRRAITRAHGVRGLDAGGPRLGVGLALWDQEWPGRSEAAALRTAYDVAVEYGPVEIRLWSSKWLLGSRRQRWAVDAIRGLPRELPW